MTSVPPPGSSVPPPSPGGSRAPAPRRRPLPVAAAVGATAFAAWAASTALAHESPPEARGMMATGAVHLVSPQDGTAVLTAGHLFPGQSTSGDVTVQNTGDADGELQLVQTGVHDVLGSGGGRLSNALRLDVVDITGATPHAIFSGALDGVSMLPVGTLPQGESRTYRLTATLPNGGTADNALQGGSVSVDWTWGAVPMTPTPTPTPGGGGTPTPTPTPGGGGTPTPTPTATPTPKPTATPTPKPKPTPRPTPTPTPEPIKSPAADVLTLRIPWQRVMMTRGVKVYAKCDHRCRLSFTAKVKTAPRHRPGRAVMRHRVFRLVAGQHVLRPNHAQRIKLRLSPRAVFKLHELLYARGRAAVVIDARVRSALGTATVERRIVIVTRRRAALHRAAQR